MLSDQQSQEFNILINSINTLSQMTNQLASEIRSINRNLAGINEKMESVASAAGKVGITGQLANIAAAFTRK